MRLKSFTAPTSTEAMNVVRETLGDDVIVVATQDDESGGVRVTVAIDEPDPDTIPPTPAASPANGHHVGPRLAGDVVDEVYRTLRFHRLPAAIGDEVLAIAEGRRWPNATIAFATALQELVRFHPLPAPGPAATPLMLVGPPGAGKTQTTAKLAARAVMDGRRAGLLTIDTERTGGAETLAAFARQLRIDPIRAETPQHLVDGLLAVSNCDYAVVDSPGCNHLDIAQMSELGRHVAVSDIEPVLVLPAGIDHMEAADIASVFRELGTRRMIVTRVDMSRRLGTVLAAANAADLALAEIADTPRIKDGLHPADPFGLAERFIPTSAAAHRQRTGTE